MGITAADREQFKMTKAEQTIKNSLYGDKTYQGYKTCEESPFVVFKGGKLWTVGHQRSQLSIDSLIPHWVARKRADILRLVENIEQAHPEAVRIAATCGGEGFSPAQSEALQTIKRFALS